MMLATHQQASRCQTLLSAIPECLWKREAGNKKAPRAKEENEHN